MNVKINPPPQPEFKPRSIEIEFHTQHELDILAALFGQNSLSWLRAHGIDPDQIKQALRDVGANALREHDIVAASLRRAHK
jgi:hypothetical protein